MEGNSILFSNLLRYLVLSTLDVKMITWLYVSFIKMLKRVLFFIFSSTLT